MRNEKASSKKGGKGSVGPIYEMTVTAEKGRKILIIFLRKKRW